MRTTDGGLNWTVATGAVGGSNFGIAYATSSVVAVTTFAGLIVRSVDGGATWTNATMLTVASYPMWSASFFDASKGLAVGSYGQIIATTNGGASWSTTTLRFDQDQGQVDVVYDIARTGSQSWFAAASSGLYVTTDEGASFTRREDRSVDLRVVPQCPTGIALERLGPTHLAHDRRRRHMDRLQSAGIRHRSTVSFGPGGVALIGSDHNVFRSTDGGARGPPSTPTVWQLPDVQHRLGGREQRVRRRKPVPALDQRRGEFLVVPPRPRRVT